MREEEVCMSRRLHRHPSGVAVPAVWALAVTLALTPSVAGAEEMARALDEPAAGTQEAAPDQGKAGGMIDPDG
jgi:hypothetical protein